MPVERVPAAGARPTSGRLVHGQMLNVDPGDRAARAGDGVGGGEASAEVAVDVDRLGAGQPTGAGVSP
jgi:hypothetical protein